MVKTNNNAKPIISIGLAVYNIEKYLRRCLECLLSQTLHNIEIIVVNDGSSDNSESIIKEYAGRDPRIVLISKNNGGLASARQVALEASKGQYFCVCDADDWVEPDMYEELYEKAIETDADVVMCDYWSEYSDGRQTVHNYPYHLEERRDLLDDALNKRFPTMVWNKMFKHSLFEKYNLSWEKGINMGEDLLMMLKILNYPVKIAYQPIPLYHYRRIIGGTSYTNSVSLSSFDQLLRIRKWLDENIDNDKYQNGLFLQWLDQAFAGLRVTEGMSAEYFKDTTLSNIPYGGFIKYSYPRQKGMVVLFSKLFGYQTGKTIVKFMYRYIYH